LLVKNNFTFLFLFFFLTQLIVAQEDVEKWLKGQVTSNGFIWKGINIINALSKVMLVTVHYGTFSILVKVGDILNFSAVNYEDLRKYINIQQFKMGNIVIDLTPKSVELKEVIINEHPEISAENLGIIPRDQVKLTSQERKLQTAGDFKPIHLLGLLGGLLAVDPILNAINGRTAMLKKAVTVEKKEFLMAKMKGLF